jgi:hypothetical protein
VSAFGISGALHAAVLLTPLGHPAAGAPPSDMAIMDLQLLILEAVVKKIARLIPLALLLASGCGRVASSGSGLGGDSETENGVPEGSADSASEPDSRVKKDVRDAEPPDDKPPDDADEGLVVLRGELAFSPKKPMGPRFYFHLERSKFRFVLDELRVPGRDLAGVCEPIRGS